MKRLLLGALINLTWISAGWAGPASLELKRTTATYPNGDPIWQLQLMNAGRVIQSWQAVLALSSIKTSTGAGRLAMAHRYPRAATASANRNPGGKTSGCNWIPSFPPAVLPWGSTTATQEWDASAFPIAKRSTALPMLCVATTSIGSLL